MKYFIAGFAQYFGISLGRGAGVAPVRRLIERLRPVATPKELVRLGGDSDGGYLVPDDLEGVVACFSPGVAATASFESALVARGIACYLADASVDEPPFDSELVNFRKKYLGVVDEAKYITLDSWVENCAPPAGDLLLQMDIEGGEWPVLLNVSSKTLERFRIIVVELHWLESLMDRVGFALMSAALERLLQRFHVVHIHPNNETRVLKTNGLAIPGLLEVTFLRKDRAEPIGFVTRFPHPLDRSNVPTRADLPLPSNWYRADH